jgi:ElaB/YqjD/DUF883 family membrane-anchored ribosome-binding protein
MAQYDADPVRGGDRPAEGSRDADTPSDPAVIRAEIRDTRERVGDTLEQIAERLNPRHVKEQVKEQVRENIRGAADHVRDNIRDSIRGSTIGRVGSMAQNAAGRVNDTGSSITETIRSNPIPAALIGIGLGWLLINGRRQSHARVEYDTYDSEVGVRPAYGARGGYAGGEYGASYDTAGTASYGSASYGSASYGGDADQGEGALDRVRDKAGELTRDVRDSAGNLVDRAQGAAGAVRGRAQGVASSVAQQTRRQAGRVENFFYDSPLAIGAATLALGLAAGLAAPTTRRESELMGGARDRLLDRAKDVAEDVKERAQDVAGRVIDEAKPVVSQAAAQITQNTKNAARDEGLSPQGVAQSVAQSGGLSQGGTSQGGGLSGGGLSGGGLSGGGLSGGGLSGGGLSR